MQIRQQQQNYCGEGIKEEEMGLSEFHEGLVYSETRNGGRGERDVNTISLVGVIHDNGIVVFLEYL